MTNTKAGVFAPFLVFAFLALITMVLIQTVRMKQLGPYQESLLGERASQVLRAYPEGERYLLYVDLAARQSARKTFYALAARGGAGALLCGELNTYTLWSNSTHNMDECFPDYGANALTSFIRTFNDYLAQGPPAYMTSDMLDSFDVTLGPERVTGIAKKRKQFTNETIQYTVDPSFNIQIPYNIRDYETLRAQSETLLAVCSGLSCVKKEIKNVEGWRVTDCGNHIACFDVKSSRALLEPLFTRFAFYLNFPHVNVVRTHRDTVVEVIPSSKKDVELYRIYTSDRPDIAQLTQELSPVTIRIKDIIQLTKPPIFDACTAVNGVCTYDTGTPFEQNKVYRSGEGSDARLFFVLSSVAQHVLVSQVNAEGRVSVPPIS